MRIFALVAGVAACQSSRQKPRPPRDSGIIPAENALAGDDSWRLDNPAYNHEIEGYGSRITLAAGDSLDVKVNVDHAQPIKWAMYRLGWYGGAGARKLLSGAANAAPQQKCPRDPRTSRVECRWSTTFTV